MKLTPEAIAKKVSEILDCRYSHHDLHYSDYGFGSYSLLTAYQGMSPFTFSILENGKVHSLVTPTLNFLQDDIFKDMLTDERHTDMVKLIEQYAAAEKWIADNNVIEILKDNLSEFYKDLLKKKKDLAGN